MKKKILDIIAASISTKKVISEDKTFMERIEAGAKLVAETLKKGGRVYLCGNGGSAADAQHIAAELSGKFYLDRKPLPVEALHVNTSFMTAVANDYSYEEVYRCAVRAFGKKGDILIGISTSGNSKNVVFAQKEAKRKGMKVISLTGVTGGALKNSCDILLNVPSINTNRIQESHIMICHIICQLVEELLFLKKGH